MACEERSCGHMGRMLCIYVDIGHCRYNGCEHHVPLLGRIFVDTDFHAFKYVNLGRQGEKRVLESGCYLKALFWSACELEHYNMFYHCFGF